MLLLSKLSMHTYTATCQLQMLLICYIFNSNNMHPFSNHYEWILSSYCSRFTTFLTKCLNGVGFMMLCSNCLCEVKSPEDQKHSNSFQFVMSWKADLGSASLTVDTAGCCHWGDCLDGASHSGLLAPWTEAQSYMLLKEVQFTPSVLFQHSSHSFYYICKICIEFSWLFSVKY